MQSVSALRAHLALGLVCGFSVPVAAAAPAPQEPSVLETVQVTATRIPAAVESIPASISVVTAGELASRGANDLRSALSLAAGVEIAPGGDGGPATSVPGLWGLKEFDAFLLVVDGVPRGGAFNPELATLVLSDIDRIEVLRGAAPVMFGATSFVGVIHVIHKAAGEAEPRVQAGYGSFGSARFSASAPLAAGGAYRQSLTLDGEHRGFSGPRAGLDRGHVLYRGAIDTPGGEVRLDFDLTRLRQDPGSPHLRAGAVLAPDLPLDANYNPADAHVDENRYQVTAGYERSLGAGITSTTLSVTRSNHDIVRGFLDEEYIDDGSTPNAAGFVQDRDITDLYFDTHHARVFDNGATLTVGLDYLYGKGEQGSGLFDYYVSKRGGDAPASSSLPVTEYFDLADRRRFAGAYVQLSLPLSEDVNLLAGGRLNRTREKRTAEEDTDTLTRTRFGGVIGFNWKLWQRGEGRVVAFADYRNTYKPAAIDFGPESEGGILDPETADSYEAGLKSQWLDGRMSLEFSAFDMRFNNLVVKQSVNGLPALANAGKEHFKGAELEMRYQLTPELLLAGTYAWHQARFGDYVQTFDGVPTQLAGHDLEMSPRKLAGVGMVYEASRGLYGSVVFDYVGSRYYNKRNTARAGSYTTFDASLGQRFGQWDLGVRGRNLTDRRPAVSESELGESQYYRLPARSYEVFLTRLF